MTTLVRGGGWLPWKWFALALGAWVFFVPSAEADDWTNPGPGRSAGPGFGTLGYGPPGVFPGFQGFGLGYHPGFGFGGNGLGVGVAGGYPYYAGPGYPHCEPGLRRHSGITPFPYFGGPGFPTPDQPNFFGPPGPLVGDQPVVKISGPGYDGDYGCFSGGPPNAEAMFAPFATSAAATGTYSGVISPAPAPDTPPPSRLDETPPSVPPSPGRPPVPPSTNRSLGIETEPVVEAGGAQGLKVAKVRPGTAAEKAGLQSGDVIRSMNGYFTTKRGNLEWIIAHAAPDHVLKMDVQAARDGKRNTLTTQLP